MNKIISSLNAKLLLLVFAAIFTLAASVIMLGTKSSLDQMHKSHETSQMVISELITNTLAGNIKYGKAEKLDAAFIKYSDDPHLDIAYIAAMQTDGTLISVKTENSALENVAFKLAEQSIENGQAQTLEFDTFYAVATPANFGKNASIVGTVVVIWDLAPSFASARENAINNILLATLVALVVLLITPILLKRVVITPIKEVTQAAHHVAEGQLDQTVLGADRQDELGMLARAIEVSRKSAIKIAQYDDEKKSAQAKAIEERTKMMGDLRAAFGDTIEAASAGDFSKRVANDFPDNELNLLAEGLNSLIETIERGLDETGSVLASIANTDLTKRIEGSYSGAFESLKNDTNAVADKFTEIVGQLRKTSGGLKNATDEMYAGSIDLSHRTTKQATEIEETSGSMNRISIAITENAEQAETAHSIVNQVSKNAQDGAQVMKEVQVAMTSINQSSTKISDIIGLIDNVAFQTNLLALNASVEAARAGESGKGFAVVAEEVRRLAQTAATASQDVNVLIDESTFEVKKGTELVVDAANKIAQMVDAAEKNSDIMSSIAKECRDQATVVEEVTAAVKRMDTMTQNNAALVEETNASIEQTKADAQTLDGIVELFQLNQSAESEPTKPNMLEKIEEDLRADQRTGIERRKNFPRKGPPMNGNLNTAINQDWSEF